LRMLLEMEGHEVRTANDGIHALETAERFRPNIALLDLGMPGLDGYEVARRMNLNPQLRPVTLAALTGWGQADDRRLTAEAGFKHHLTKPIDLGELRQILQEAAPAD
ncbi:MAG TPA: response regulator, partial [Burkholderiales bacterium]|nr:response regulator [Burkholderiales bacterium]